MTPQRVPKLEELVGGVAVFELLGPGNTAAIHPAERPIVAGAVDARVSQFAAGRQCARAALDALGLEPVALVRSGDGRQPRWPSSVWGAISHTDNYAVAIVGRKADRAASVGIDAEQVGRVHSHLYRRLFIDAERIWLEGLPSGLQARAATELFGLKESFYKAQFPLTGAWVGFEDVYVGRRPPEGLDDGDGHRNWALAAVTELPALDAVEWPCQGWSVARGEHGEVSVTAVSVLQRAQAAV